MAGESGMDAGVEHHGFALVLDDVARASDFITAAEGDEGQFVGGIDGVLGRGGHGGMGAFGGHDRVGGGCETRRVREARMGAVPVRAQQKKRVLFVCSMYERTRAEGRYRNVSIVTCISDVDVEAGVKV